MLAQVGKARLLLAVMSSQPGIITDFVDRANVAANAITLTQIPV